jgi:hypothetical protein
LVIIKFNIFFPQSEKLGTDPFFRISNTEKIPGIELANSSGVLEEFSPLSSLPFIFLLPLTPCSISPPPLHLPVENVPLCVHSPFSLLLLFPFPSSLLPSLPVLPPYLFQTYCYCVPPPIPSENTFSFSPSSLLLLFPLPPSPLSLFSLSPTVKHVDIVIAYSPYTSTFITHSLLSLLNLNL